MIKQKTFSLACSLLSLLLGLHVGCTNLYSNRIDILNNPRSDGSKTDLEKTYVTVVTAEEEASLHQ